MSIIKLVIIFVFHTEIAGSNPAIHKYLDKIKKKNYNQRIKNQCCFYFLIFNKGVSKGNNVLENYNTQIKYLLKL